MMKLRLPRSIAATALAAACTAVLVPGPLAAQETNDQLGQEKQPAAALASLLSSACRGSQSDFAIYLTSDSATAFRALPEEQRSQFMKRFSLSDIAGRPLLDNDAQNHIVLRCETPDLTVEYRFGAPRVHENLAFIPVTVVDGQKTQFGMVREGGGWRLLSLGLVMIDIPQLTKQWAEQDLEAREAAAVDTIRAIADAVETYRRAYGKLPDSLVELGPAPPGEVSPDQASLLEEHVAAGEKGGYRFRYRLATGTDQATPSFEIVASPEAYGKSGRKSFFLDTSGKIHSADKQGAMASAADPTIPDEKTQ